MGGIHDVDAAFFATIPGRMVEHVHGHLLTRPVGRAGGGGEGDDPDEGHHSQDDADDPHLSVDKGRAHRPVPSVVFTFPHSKLPLASSIQRPAQSGRQSSSRFTDGVFMLEAGACHSSTGWKPKMEAAMFMGKPVTMVL